MKRISTTPTVLPSTNMGAVGKAWDEVSASFDRFCLAAGIDALGAMMEKDAEEACGARHARSEERRGHRWARTQGAIAGEKPARRPFKAYPIGYFHVDIAEVRTEEGQLNLFVAIDRTSKFALAQLHEVANVHTAAAFLSSRRL